jgi:ParB family chromosome partitioning protein
MSFADLAADPILDAPVPPISVATPPPTVVALHEVAPNPINPRQRIGDLTELAASLRSIGQLQPCTVVTRAAYLTQYPEHAEAIGSSSYVAVAGGRRRAAAELAGLATLDIAVRDSLAESRETLYAASITENIEREDFDVLDEARAVQKLVEICGDGVKAGERLSRSKGWGLSASPS